MATTEKITLDRLTKDSVSILKQQFDENGQQVGLNFRCAYMNSESSRAKLQEELPKDKWNDLITVWGNKPIIKEPIIPEPSLEDMKADLIKRMSNECNKAILNGVDLLLPDGETYHFSTEIEDQLKIQALALKAANGETELPYHADGEPCRFFTAEEILMLNQAMENLVTYETTYFNSLKTYINSIENTDDLNSIKYGMEIPEDYQSEVYKALIDIQEVQEVTENE
ncbi:MAG: hypothetical protein J1E56_07385 [Ruminococcus sp.]|nr:hypothetical protein [Ruminococcus sp.]